MLSFLMLGLVLGCSGKEGESDSASVSSDTATSSNNDTDNTNDTNDTDDTNDTPPDPNNPVITEADAWCYAGGENTDASFWGFRAVADDPQGVETLESFIPDAISFRDGGGNEVKTVTIVCTSTGECTATMSEEQLGVGCALAENFRAVFTVQDEDGNVSDPVEAACRQGTDAAG